MNENEIINLLDRYRNGEYTVDEKAAVESWFILYAMQATSAGEIPNFEETRNEIWNNLAIKHKKRDHFPFIRYAAAVLVLIGITWVYFAHVYNDKIDIKTKISFDVRPGGNKATLTLANGKVISLNVNGKLAMRPGTLIANNSSNGVVIFQNQSNKQEKVKLDPDADGLNTITTPVGGQYQLILSDQTRIFLNAASSITFPSSFAGNQRKVSIVGEVYFEVAKNPKKPFIVNTSDQQVTVLGTHFNVSAYPNETVKTTLSEGHVLLLQPSTGQSQPLKTDQQAVLLSKNGFDVKTVTASDAIAWIHGMFIFQKTPLKEAMRQISRWYDVQVDYESLPNTMLDARLPRNLNLIDVLEGIQFAGKFKFKLIAGRRLILIK
ncbi:FecR family protein [Chitinophaga sp. CF118]|uniref:FecR family protein n=1 Tax=Chitinophaga sp. CF118 TaxID=1884367 RepID=UPI0008E6D708|nr:FecR domain-containing protein [Chitinophaga sp. CF118]SFF06989.1 FecR family protein [Chitinophaga sp. CF118]